MPAWSLIIPTFDRPAALRRTLQAIAQMRMPAGGVEVIVVDDGSSDPPSALGWPIEVRVFSQSRAGPAAARNRGAREARGVFLAFLDDDCSPRSDWLTSLAQALATAPAALVGGHTLNKLENNPYAEASQRLVDAIYRQANNACRKGQFFTSNNLAMARETFFTIGGFDESYRQADGEDRAFCLRWRARGGLLHHVPDAVIEHLHDLDLEGFWRQHVAYGRGAFTVHQQFPGVEMARIPRVALLLDYVLGPLWRDKMKVGLIQASLAALSQLATTTGYAREAVRSARHRPPRRSKPLSLSHPQETRPSP